MSHLNRNVDFSMRSFAVVLNFVTRNYWPSQYHYMEKSQLVNRGSMPHLTSLVCDVVFLHMSHLNRNVDFSMRSFVVVLNFVARNYWPSQYHYMEKSQLVNRDHSIAIIGSWPAGLAGSHVFTALCGV